MSQLQVGGIWKAPKALNPSIYRLRHRILHVLRHSYILHTLDTGEKGPATYERVQIEAQGLRSE